MQLHEKFNELRDFSWVDLVRMQQRQIEMLERLVARGGSQDEQSETDQTQRMDGARLSPVAQVEVDAVRNWVKRQQASQRPNAREMFAALFVQPPTS